jgi:hypothetical protein
VTYAYDDEPLTLTESLAPAKPTTGLPAAAPAPTAPTTPTTPTTPSTPAPTTPASTGTVNFLTVNGDEGAPVDLWDVDWPQAGYYWTVVAVDAIAPTSISTTISTAAAIGDTRIAVANPSGFATGDVVTVGNVSNQEVVTVTGVDGNVLSVATALKQGHGATEPVSRTSGSLTYRDRELPQEVCAAGRVMRFGKSSEPTLVSAGTPFVSGLSPRGRTISATSASSSFYGAPLVAWTPALGAEAYHVQWSKKRAPFVPVVPTAGTGSGAAGFLTWASSAVLPLQPGTWWYRVRGVNFGLPQNAQFMGWSEPTRLVVTKPTFAVVSAKKKTAKKP